jgi:hypothetical protein
MDKSAEFLAPDTDLGLAQTSISDASLPELSRLTNLHSINLQETMLTEAGIKRLKQALPQCSIHR